MSASHTVSDDTAVQRAYHSWLRHYYHMETPPETRFAKYNPLQEAFFAGYLAALAKQTG